MRFILTILLLSWVTPCLAHIMEPNAPVIDFKLPVFGKNGYKAWDLQGAEGVFKNSNEIDVKTMTLRTFSGAESLNIDTSIQSPLATINVKENSASSNEQIDITGPDYTAKGNTWTWDGNTNQINIKSNVVVTFSQEHHTNNDTP